MVRTQHRPAAGIWHLSMIFTEKEQQIEIPIKINILRN